MSDLSIIIVSYNTKDLTMKCLESIYNRQWKVNFEVILVDNASSDGTVSSISKKYKKVTVVESGSNLGFAGGNNLGLAKSLGRWCLLLNSDTEVADGSIDALIEDADSGRSGILSAKLLNKDGSFQANGGQLPGLWSNFVWICGLDDILPRVFGKFSYQMRKLEDFRRVGVGWVSATAMLISGKVLEEVGLLDDKIFMYGEDVDYCMRARKEGFNIGWCEKAEIVHLGGGSSKNPKMLQLKGEIVGLYYIYRKHFGDLKYCVFRVMILPFLFGRMVAFLVLGQFNRSYTYAKIITQV